MTSQLVQHLIRTFEVREQDEDRVVGFLAECGTTGVEVRAQAASTLHLLAYFDGPPPGHPSLPKEIGGSVDGISWVGEEWIDQRDWLEEFRRQASPIAVGDRFLIDPGELVDPPPAEAGRFLLRLPARTAFGTGSHETTQLALEWLERLPVRDRRFLDVGSGSGILCFAARCLGASLAVGFDFDLPSALMSGQYERLNANASSSGRVALFAGTVGAIRCGGAQGATQRGFDVVLVNVLPHRILPEATGILSALAPGGTLIVSGLLSVEEEEVLARWQALGMEPVSHHTKGEWVAWHLEDCRGSRDIQF